MTPCLSVAAQPESAAMPHLPGEVGQNGSVDAPSSSEPRESGATDDQRPLEPGEQYARFGLVRRSPTATAERYQQHWLAFMVPTTLFLTALFIYFAIRNG